MIPSAFFENEPLYKKYRWNNSDAYLSNIKPTSIHMACMVCKSDQTFNVDQQLSYHPDRSRDTRLEGRVFSAVYRCTGCNGFYRIFLIHVSKNEEYLMKVGQFPPWEIGMDKDLESMLGNHSSYYKNGLVCESQGYGIGACSYYRRIVEEIIDELLSKIAELVPEAEREKYNEALATVKTTRRTEDKIQLVEDLLPDSLKAEGQNPLKELHGLLSEGLHGRTDDECIDDAMHIREVLTYLVNQVLESKRRKSRFSDSMKELLKKRTERIVKAKVTSQKN